MAVRKDEVQVNVEINGAKAGSTLKELETSAKQLRRELRLLPVDSDEFTKKAAELNKVNGELKNISNTIKGVDNNLKQSTQQVGFWQRALSGAAGVITGMFTVQALQAAAQAVVSFIKEGFAGIKEASANTAQLEAVIASTGGAAGLAREDIDKMALSLRNATGIDDEAIRRSAAVLLTFTNVTGENFKRGEQAILDMSVALGTDLQGATIQVGKALNDPIQGISALSKVGVSFTENQKEFVKQLVETNKVAEAQAFILTELEKEFGGVAAAVAATEGGPWAKFQLMIGDIQESLAEKFVPAINSTIEFFIDLYNKSGPVVDIFRGIFEVFGQVWDQVKQLLASFGLFTGKVDAAGLVVKTLTTIYQNLTIPIRLVLTLIREFITVLNSVVAVGGGVANAISVVFNGIRELALRTFTGLKDLIVGALTFDAEQIQKGLDNTKGAFSSFGKNVADAYNTGYNEVRIKQFMALQEAAKKDDEVNKDLAKKRGQEIAHIETDAEKKEREKAAKDEIKRRLDLKQRLAEIDNQVAQAQVDAMQEGIEKDKAREDLRYNLQLQAVAKQITDLRALKATEEQIELENERLREAAYDQHIAEKLKIDEKYSKAAAEKAKKTLEEQKKQDDEAAKAKELRYKEDLDKQNIFFDTLLTAQLGKTAALLENERVTEAERQKILEDSRLAQELIERQRIEALSSLNNEYGKSTIEQDKVLAQQRLENAQRTSELRIQSEDILKQAIGDTFRFGIEMLSQDEAARRKNADLIKAFTIGQIFVDTEREVAGYFANPGSTATFGAAGAIRAALAIARAAFSVSRVVSQEFSGGGFTGPGGDKDHTGHRVAGIVHENEWVSPAWMTRHPVFSQVIHQLEGVRTRGFADGGFTTTPVFTPSLTNTNNLESLMVRLVAAAENWPQFVRGIFTYTDLIETLQGGQEVQSAGDMS